MTHPKIWLLFVTLMVPAAALSGSSEVSLKDAAWLAGAWQGEGLGGYVEEVWTPARGGAMMGSFRLIRDDQVVFYEIFTLVEHEGGLQLRLKHFEPDLVAWEEREKVVTFSFESVEPGVLRFKSLVFQRVDDDALRIDLRLRQNDGTVKTELFHMRRMSLDGH